MEQYFLLVTVVYIRGIENIAGVYVSLMSLQGNGVDLHIYKEVLLRGLLYRIEKIKF